MKAPIWLIDKDKEAFSRTDGLPISRIQTDAFEFLSLTFSSLHPENTLIPSVPVHLAFEWLRKHCGKGVEREDVPEGLSPLLPNTWRASDGSLLLSYADFVCPEDCPEPSDHCTVTGEKRGAPLYDLLRKIDVPNYRVHIIRSRQLAPGVGGYRVAGLSALMDDLGRDPGGKWLVGTACRCHGIITAFSLRANP
jgi:hypothetical protein